MKQNDEITSGKTIASFIPITQSHVLYRDAEGKIWDSWYDGKHWNLQQINLSGITPGPAAVGDPSSFIIYGQSHVIYRDAEGKIWDSWNDGYQHWQLQQINLSGITAGPAAVGDPSSFIISEQSHVIYRDAEGKIWDSWYDGKHWNLQQINLSGITAGPAAIGDPSSFIYVTQLHVPEQPFSLRVINVGDRKISVSWDDQAGDEDGFLVRFHGKLAEQSDDTGTQTVDSNARTADLLGLHSGYQYTISVVAFNAAGESPYSNEVTATVPARVISVSKEGVGNSAVFTVNGSGFSPNIRVVNRATATNGQQVQFDQTTGPDGKYTARQSIACVSGVQLTFNAFEDPNPNATYSNNVITTCP